MVEYNKKSVGRSDMCNRIADTYPEQLRRLWRKTEETGKEHGQLFFETAGGLMYSFQTEGNRDKVGSEAFEDLFDRLPDHAENIITVHTHPSNGMEPSMGDMVAFVNSAMVTEKPAQDGFVQGLMVLTSIKPLVGRDELSLYGFVLNNETTAQDASEVRDSVRELLKTRQERIKSGDFRGFPDLRAQTTELVNNIAHECGTTLKH